MLFCRKETNGRRSSEHLRAFSATIGNLPRWRLRKSHVRTTAVFFNRQSLDLYISSFVGYFKKTNPFVVYFICFNNVIVHDQCFLSLHKLKTKRGFVKHVLTFRLNNWPLISLLTLRKSGQLVCIS